MNRPRFILALLAIGILGTFACQAPRMVKVDQQGAIVAMPKNTDVWPTYYRSKAEKLLAQRFPNGYDIVDEEEIVTGKHEHTNSRTDIKEKPKLLLGGAETSTEQKDGGTALAGLTIPLGETEEETQSTTTYSDVTEYRITVRAR